MPTTTIEVSAGTCWYTRIGASGRYTVTAASTAKPTDPRRQRTEKPALVRRPACDPDTDPGDQQRRRARGGLAAAECDHGDVVGQGEDQRQHGPHPREPDHRPKAEKHYRRTGYEQPHRDQVEAQQVEVQRVPRQQHTLDEQRQPEPEDPDDDVGLAVVDRQLGALAPRDRHRHEHRRGRDGPDVAGEGVVAADLDQVHDAAVEREAGQDGDQPPAHDQPVRRVHRVVPLQNRGRRFFSAVGGGDDCHDGSGVRLRRSMISAIASATTAATAATAAQIHQGRPADVTA